MKGAIKTSYLVNEDAQIEIAFDEIRLEHATVTVDKLVLSREQSATLAVEVLAARFFGRKESQLCKVSAVDGKIVIELTEPHEEKSK